MDRAIWAEGFERPTGEVDAQRRATWRLADAVRELAERIATSTEAPTALLDAAAAQVAAATATLAPGDGGAAEDGSWSSTGEATSLLASMRMDRNPVTGAANPLAPPLKLRFTESGVVGVAHFGTAHEGPPGAVHGGWLAAAFDALLGMAQSMSGRTGLTGTLTVRYRRPTPLHDEVRFEGALDRVDGRKLLCSGRSYVGGVLTAEADATFVTVDFAGIPGRLARVRDERDGGSAEQHPAG